MASKAWAKFPHPSTSFDYAGERLAKHWDALHAGDGEVFPDAAHIREVLKRHPKAGKAAQAEAIAERLQDAWRAYHRGDFEQAWREGRELGPLGASVAVKAGGIHAVYLVEDEATRIERFRALAELAEEATQVLPDDPNTHYRMAFALGRYAQGISIAKALAQGLAGRVRAALERTLELAPKHAEAHSALGLYHAEIVAKVGAMIGGLTYGAKASTGEKLLLEATRLTPKAPIAHIEYAHGLLLLYGDRREDDAAAAFEKASRLKPRDAMEKLDVEYARDQIEE